MDRKYISLLWLLLVFFYFSQTIKANLCLPVRHQEFSMPALPSLASILLLTVIAFVVVGFAVDLTLALSVVCDPGADTVLFVWLLVSLVRMARLQSRLDFLVLDGTLVDLVLRMEDLLAKAIERVDGAWYV